MSRNEGDYELRERGLEKLMRPKDLWEYGVLVEEMRQGKVEVVPQWAIVGYGILRHYALTQKKVLGSEVRGHCDHTVGYMWSAIQLGHGGGRWPPLVTSAFSELING